MKLFLVEDEVIALQSLKRKIEDLGDEWQIVGTAYNGVEALKKLESVTPDILLTDIRMPDMDGIELVERLAKTGRNVLPIIISGYKEFDYAKQALRLGVEDYLLKPVDPAELDACLKRSKKQIEQRRKKQNLTTLLLADEPASLSFAQGESRLAAAYLIIANALSDFDYIIHPDVPYSPPSAITSLLTNHFPAETVIRCMDGFFSNEKVVILGGPGLEDKNLRNSFIDTANILHKNLGRTVTIFFRHFQNQNELETTIRRCRKGAVDVMILGKNVVTDKKQKVPVVNENMNERVRLLTLYLRQGDFDSLYRHVLSMFQEWEAADRTAHKIQLDLEFILNTLRYNLSNHADHPLSSQFMIENIACFSRDIVEFSDNFCQLLKEIFRPETSRRSISNQELVSDIEEYFQINLFENITLEALADEMGVSKAYLCRVFKKEKDETPIDYFTKLKIERAKELIITMPQTPLREISDLLGFNDMYYFSKVFKRITGVPPSEMRSAETQ